MLGQPTIAPLGLSMYPKYKQNHLYQTDKIISQIITKIAVRTYRRRTHSKIMLRNRSIRLMHLFAITVQPVHTGPCTNRNPVYTVLFFSPELITLKTILINPLQTGTCLLRIPDSLFSPNA